MALGHVAPVHRQKFGALRNRIGNLVQRKGADIGGGQFQPQGHPLHQPADTQHGGHVGRREFKVQVVALSRLDKKAHRRRSCGFCQVVVGGKGQGLDVIKLFIPQVEPFARGDKHLHPRRRQDFDHQFNRRFLIEQMFKVIEDQQQLLLAQRVQERSTWIAALQW